MTAIKIVVAAAALTIAAGMIAGASAQQPAQQQSEPSARSETSGMGPGMMGGHGMGSAMMGGYGMGPGMMGGYGGMGMGRWMMGGAGSIRMMCNAMTGHIEGRLAYIKAELKITAAEEPLWDAYAAAARANGKTMRAHCTAMMGRRDASQVNLPDRIDRHERLMAAQLDAMRAMNKALKPLYAALSDSQKQTADELLWGNMGMML